MTTSAPNSEPATQVAWVTGAASGIGNAIAVRLSSQGIRVLAIDINESGLQQVRQSQGFDTVVCDVADADKVTSLKDQLPEALQAPQICVNAAGIVLSTPIADHDEENWLKVMAVNLNGPFHITRAVLPAMIQNGYGRIVNISSGTGFRLSAGAAAYGSSKAGVFALTKATAIEGAAHGVTANAIAPGIVDTPMIMGVAKDRATLEMMAKNSPIANPMGIILKPEDIAHAAAFFAAPESYCITGQVMHVNAGAIMP